MPYYENDTKKFNVITIILKNMAKIINKFASKNRCFTLILISYRKLYYYYHYYNYLDRVSQDNLTNLITSVLSIFTLFYFLIHIRIILIEQKRFKIFFYFWKLNMKA